jgi:ElaB/YqjD/DUF883 family membrane-anchored ribosome-binding protein
MTTPSDHSAMHDKYDHARDTAAKALHDAKEKAVDAYVTSKASARDAAHRASEGIEGNPLAILAGGLAVGALAGALIPRSAKEKELLAPVGRRLSDTARQAVAAAKDAGRQQLEEAGLTRGAAKDRGRAVLDGVVKAVSSAGTAAAQSTKRSDPG